MKKIALLLLLAASFSMPAFAADGAEPIKLISYNLRTSHGKDGDNVWMKTRCAWNTSEEWKKLNGLMNDALGASGSDQQDLWNQCFDILAENVVLYPLLQVVTPTRSWRESANPDGVKVSDSFKGIGTTGVQLAGITTVKA